MALDCPQIESNTLDISTGFSNHHVIWPYLPLNPSISQPDQHGFCPNHIRHIFFLCTCTGSFFAFFQTFSMMQLNYKLLWNVSFHLLMLSALFLTVPLCIFLKLFPYWQLMIKSMGSVGWHKWDIHQFLHIGSIQLIMVV